jgi:phosphate starvation-inducible PhoH-like protein
MGSYSLNDYRSLTSILKPITENQNNYLISIKNNPITIVDGPAGTGKTFLAMLEGLRACLSDQKQDKWCQSLVLLRPGVGVGQDLGYLPGSYGEKIHLFMRPFKDIGAKILGEKEYARVEKFISYETPYHRRGTTFDNAFVIVDEAQNITPTEMIMILTRLGKRGKIVIAGDGRQSDIRYNNGLREAQIRLSSLKSIKVIKTTLADMQRSGIVAKIIKAWYNGYYEENSDDLYGESYEKRNEENILDEQVTKEEDVELHYDDDLSIFSWDTVYDNDGD